MSRPVLSAHTEQMLVEALQQAGPGRRATSCRQ